MNERVYLSLLKLIYSFAKRKVPVDANLLNQVGEIIIPNTNLAKYVTSMDITSKKTIYFPYKKEILINSEDILRGVLVDSEALELDNFATFFYFYSELVGVLIHEFSHADQFRNIEEEKKDIETRLLATCWQFNQYDNRFWAYAPEERLANHHQNFAMLQILKQVKKDFPKLYYLVLYCLYDEYLNGYEEGVTPTKHYFEQIGIGKSYQEFSEMGANLPLQRRLTLGLDLTDREINEVQYQRRRALNKLSI